jgi:hypothetical protein
MKYTTLDTNRLESLQLCLSYNKMGLVQFIIAYGQSPQSQALQSQYYCQICREVQQMQLEGQIQAELQQQTSHWLLQDSQLLDNNLLQ